MRVYLAFGDRIKPVEARVTSATHVWVDVPELEGEVGSLEVVGQTRMVQRPRFGPGFGYFDTWAEARDFLGGRVGETAESARVELKQARARLGRVAQLEAPVTQE